MGVRYHFAPLRTLTLLQQSKTTRGQLSRVDKPLHALEAENLNDASEPVCRRDIAINVQYGAAAPG